MAINENKNKFYDEYLSQSSSYIVERCRTHWESQKNNFCFDT